MPQAMTAVLPECASIATVETDIGVYSLDAGAALAVPLHVSLYLLWRPLLLNQQGEYPLAHVEGESAYATHAVLALFALFLSKLVVVAVHPAIALYLTVDCADVHFQVLCNHFFANFVLE